MTRAQLLPCLACFTALLLLTASRGATEATNTFSGRIVDVNGHPVSGLTLITRPTKLINGHAITAMEDVTIPFSDFNKSDNAGYFTITNVKTGPVQLEVISPIPGQSQQGFEIVSMKIGPTTFYPTIPAHMKGLKFAIEPGADFEDVIVTVRPRTRYRGQVVFKNGTPLAHKTVKLDEGREYKQGKHSVRGGLVDFPTQTDANGYFVRYVDEPDFEVARYTVVVKCQGLSETAEFTLKSGEQQDDLVFMLQGTPMSMRGRIVFEDGTPLPNAMFVFDMRSDSLDLAPSHHSSRQPVTDDAGYFVEYLNQPGPYIASVEYQGLSATSNFTAKRGEERAELVFMLNGAPVIFEILGVEMMAPTIPNTIGVWIGKPNGSQYKSVRCSSWKDAQTKAHSEGAQLVTINDKAEQEWLVEQFGFLSYWIGLNYSAEAGEWGWSSDDPFTYTNWANGQPERNEAESFGFMDGGYHGEWRVVLQGDEILEWRTPKAAILEKEAYDPTATSRKGE